MKETQWTSGLKGQQAHSPGQRPGWNVAGEIVALKGQKNSSRIRLLPFQGAPTIADGTQGDALGYVLAGLSGRFFPVISHLLKD